MSYIKIITSQNVNIHFKLASLGERFLASLIDTIIILAYSSIAFLILDVVGILKNVDDAWSRNAIIMLVLLPAFTYTLLQEIFLDGQTLGKMAMNIKVVKTEGYRVSFFDLFGRWILRIVDIWVFAYIPIIGIISIATSKKAQRLGDLAVGTAVISLNKKHNISSSILERFETSAKITFPTAIYLNDKDLRIIKDTFEIAKEKQDYATIEKLRKKIETVTQTQKGKLNNYDYIKTIIRDYNQLTQDM
jgi:uncharacterized RDD family membrane protein YckC